MKKVWIGQKRSDIISFGLWKWFSGGWWYLNGGYVGNQDEEVR